MAQREHRKLSDELAEVAQDLIATEPELADIRRSDATIVYLTSDKAKKGQGRVICGECERVADKNKWAIPADFTITLYTPNCRGMSDEQVRIVLFHELLHVGIRLDRDGEEVYGVVPHDLQDFRAIVDRYGTDWAEVG